ncbi:MAG: tetratricopeptide repeat-containing sulfotransferase family protein [Methyloligellaceae bacterium]
MGELERAKTLFEKGLSLEPENLKQRVNYANLLAQLDRRMDAIKILQELTKIAPDVPELQLNLVELMKDSDEAVGTFEAYANAYALKPDDPNIALNYANKLREAGRDEEVVSVLSKSLKNDPNNALLLNSYALSLSNLSRYEKALEISQRAIELDPQDHSAYVTKGFVERTAGMILESNRSYEEALSLDPANSQIHFNIADNFSHINRFKDSLYHLDKALEGLPPTDERHLQKCHILSELRRDDELIAICQEKFSNPSDELASLVALGKIADKSVQLKVLAELDELWSRKPFSSLEDITAAQFTKAQLLHGLGKNEEAWKEFLKANNSVFNMIPAEVRRNELEAQNLLEEAKKYDGHLSFADPTNHPVSLFILGPSRSGKTSVEKLLGEIEGVQQGFENQIFTDLIKLFKTDFLTYGSTIFSGLDEDALSKLSDRYFREMSLRYEKFKMSTNTNPGLITEVGAILNSIPNSKFVFLKRDRADLATRILFKKYLSGNLYAYNLVTILNHIEWYYELISIWSEKFPEHCMIISYEQFIEDPLTVRNQIMNFCGRENSDSIREKPFDDRGFSKVYSDKFSAEKSNLSLHELNIIDEAKANEILYKISSSKQAKLISCYNLEPDVGFQHNNAELLLSKKFRLVGGRRQFALLFVKIDEGVFPRLIYQSASHGTYRLADGIEDGWFSKGPGESLISPPVIVGQYLLRSQSIVSGMLTLSEITDLLNFGEDHLYYFQNPKPQNLSIISGLADQSQTCLQTEEGETIREPEDINIVPGFEPDCKNALLEFDALTLAAGQVNVAVYPSINREVTYSIMRDHEDKIWIADAHHETSDLNEFGLPKKSVNFGDLVRPRWERRRYIPSQFASDQRDPISGKYHSNWNYVREIPAIRAWYAETGRIIPKSE